MKASKQRRIVYVDTSYLTNMPRSERAGWNKLLNHSKACAENLSIAPQLEIHVSEIALNEYRSRMVDRLRAKIGQANNKLRDLQDEWNKNDLAKELENPFPTDRDIFPQDDEIESKSNLVIQNMLDSGGIRKIETKPHHGEAVWKKYFSWAPPFDFACVTERGEKNVRLKRRTHIPDAWILEAAIDAQKKGDAMLCLCGDDNLSNALERHGHSVYKTAEEVLQVLFPVEVVAPKTIEPEGVEKEDGARSPLELLLNKAPNQNAKQIFLRLLGFVAALDTPTHESLIEAVVSRGYDRKLTEACAVILSDSSKPFIKNTGSHYIVGDEEICTAAAEQLTAEIIAMLENE